MSFSSPLHHILLTVAIEKVTVEESLSICRLNHRPVNIHFPTPDSINKVHAIERPPRFILASHETLLVSNPIKSEVAVEYV